MKAGTRAGTMVGHLPKKTSSICSLFIRKGGTIDCEVMDPNRKYSRDLPQGGLEVPCVLTLRGTKDLVDKAVKLLAISIFRKKYFRNLNVITKITKILYYENLEPYGICDCLSESQASSHLQFCLVKTFLEYYSNLKFSLIIK